MSYLPNYKTLLDLGAGVTVETVGTTYRIDYTDNQKTIAETWAGLGLLTQAGGADTPTGVFAVEFSADGTNWVRVPVTESATDTDETVPFFKALSLITRYVRGVAVPGGTTPTLTGVLQLATDADVSFNAI